MSVVSIFRRPHRKQLARERAEERKRFDASFDDEANAAAAEAAKVAVTRSASATPSKERAERRR